MTSTAGDIALLALAALALLAALTLAGEAARARLAAGRPGAGVETFVARVNSWWATAVLLALALVFGRGGVVLLFAIAAFAALREFAT